MKEFVETKSSQVSPIGPQGIRRKSRRKFLKTSAVALGSVSELSMLGVKIAMQVLWEAKRNRSNVPIEWLQEIT